MGTLAVHALKHIPAHPLLSVFQPTTHRPLKGPGRQNFFLFGLFSVFALFCSPVCFQHLEQSLAHSGSSVNIEWMNEVQTGESRLPQSHSHQGWSVGELQLHTLSLWLCCAAHRILVSRSGIEPASPALEAQSLNHWTAQGRVPKAHS